MGRAGRGRIDQSRGRGGGRRQRKGKEKAAMIIANLKGNPSGRGIRGYEWFTLGPPWQRPVSVGQYCNHRALCYAAATHAIAPLYIRRQGHYHCMHPHQALAVIARLEVC